MKLKRKYLIINDMIFCNQILSSNTNNNSSLTKKYMVREDINVGDPFELRDAWHVPAVCGRPMCYKQV